MLLLLPFQTLCCCHFRRYCVRFIEKKNPHKESSKLTWNSRVEAHTRISVSSDVESLSSLLGAKMVVVLAEVAEHEIYL